MSLEPDELEMQVARAVRAEERLHALWNAVEMVRDEIECTARVFNEAGKPEQATWMFGRAGDLKSALDGAL